MFILSCEKNKIDNEYKLENPYELPWNTKFISFKDSTCGNHAYGYKLYYKDSLLSEKCDDFRGICICDSLLVNDSILHLLLEDRNHSFVWTTINGGYTWEEYNAGPPEFLKFHFVNTMLTYCVTFNQNDLYFTGIGESDLSVYKANLINGTHYIRDLGTNINDFDSTLIKINDSVKYIILF